MFQVSHLPQSSGNDSASGSGRQDPAPDTPKPASLRAFLYFCLATSGRAKHGFFVASILVLSISDAMTSDRYQASQHQAQGQALQGE